MKFKILPLLIYCWLPILLVSCSESTAPQSYEQSLKTRPSYLQLPQAKIISDFQFVDGEGQPFKLTNLTRQWSFIYFGFTRCPDICPPHLTQMATFKRLLEPQTDLPMQFLFASTDPERDTPEIIKRYAAAFDPEFRGIVGDQGNLLKLTTQVGVYYEKQEMDHSDHSDHANRGNDNYLINHTGSIVVFNPEGQYVGFFQSPHDPEKMVAEWLEAIH